MSPYREIEFNIFSAHDLRDVRIFGGKMSPYVVAWIHHDLKAFSPADVKGGTEPTWNAKLLLYCDEAALDHPDEAVVYFELHDSGSTSNRLIGSLSYPLSDLPGNMATRTAPPSEAVFLNLPVKRPSGREQGVLNFTLKMGAVTHQPIPSDALHEDAPSTAPHAAGMADEESSFAAGCCVLPHFSRDDHTFHSHDGPNMIAH